MSAISANSGLSQNLLPRPGCTVVHALGEAQAQESAMSHPPSTIRLASSGRMKWRLAGGAVVALLIGALWRSEDVPPTPSQPMVSLTGSAPVTFAPPSAGMGDGATELAALKAELNTAALAIDQSSGAAPEGPVRERPDYVSPMEWMVLQGVANQHANAERELSRMVHFLRFNKQLERWEGLNAGGDPALRRALASALVTDLPTRVQQGDVAASDARTLLMRLLADAEPDVTLREARLGDTMARIEGASRAAAQALAQSGNAVLPVGSPPAGTTAPAR